MAITYIGNAAKRTSPSWNIPIPAGCQVGNIAVVLVNCHGTVDEWAAFSVSGSTINRYSNSDGTIKRYICFYKFLDSTDIANGYLTSTGAQTSDSICTVYSGVSAVSPVVASLGNSDYENTVYTSSPDRAYTPVASLGGDRPANHLEVIQVISFKLPYNQATYMTTAGFTHLYATPQDFAEWPITGAYHRLNAPSPTGINQMEITPVGINGGAQSFSNRIILREENRTPNVPTGLTVTSDVLDTTPNFSASISDPDTTQQIKAQFYLWKAGVDQGIIDSGFRVGAGTVTAEWASALAPGVYDVLARTVDDLGAVSAWSSGYSFSIKTTVEKDVNLLWDVDTLITKELTATWNVLTANEKDIELLWGTTEQIETDFQLNWNVYPIWTLIDSDPESPVNWEEAVS